MYLRRCYRRKDGKRHAYWALVESYRTARGPRQRVVAYLGELDAQGRVAVQAQAAGTAHVRQQSLDAEPEAQWVEVDLPRVRVERSREFGGPWLGLTLLQRLDLRRVLDAALPPGREEVSWSAMALVLVLGRLCTPSSELQLAAHVAEASAVPELLDERCGGLVSPRTARK